VQLEMTYPAHGKAEEIVEPYFSTPEVQHSVVINNSNSNNNNNNNNNNLSRNRTT
jgi:hypothetical protein